MDWTREDLIAEGWPEDSPFEPLLDEASRLIAQGNTDRAYILKRLDRKHPRQQATLTIRAEGLPFSEAIEAESKEELKNLKAARRTMRELMACPVVTAGALMPDTCPSGSAIASIPVGGAISAQNAILPAAHGSDICCSMQATLFEAPREMEVSPMMDALVSVTRFGPGGRSPDTWIPHRVLDEPVWENPFLRGFQNYARMHLADQGNGNHFAFLGRMIMDDAMLQKLHAAGHGEVFARIAAGKPYHVLVTHHGSRGLGARVFQRGLEAAVAATKQIARGIPEAAAWLDVNAPQGRDYWQALQYVARWTRANHALIHERFLAELGMLPLGSFGNEHNFVWQRGEHFLHGKGATPAWRDDIGRPLLGLIPLNMASPILVVLGGDQDAFLSFAPHGAGRNLSRRAVLRTFRLKDGSFDEEAMERALTQATKGIDVRWYQGKADLSESPLGYKPAQTVREQIAQFELATVVGEVAPLGSVMAGRGRGREEELTPKQRRQMEHRSERRKQRQALRERWDD